MLAYQNIYLVKEALERQRRNYGWGSGNHTRDSDAMLMFTIGSKADEDAQQNLRSLLELGRHHSASHLILHDNRIQFLTRDADHGIEQDLLPKTWVADYLTWTGHNRVEFKVEDSGHGVCQSFRPWRRAFATRDTQGIYELSTGKRLTNRHDIIERIWDHGFAAWRGRPLCVADLRWSGTRTDLEELTEIAGRYWTRRFQSDVAKKMCSAYTAINRYAAWPGAW